jgi:hypothetical protein
VVEKSSFEGEYFLTSLGVEIKKKELRPKIKNNSFDLGLKGQ